MKIAVKDLRANPFRNLDAYPPRADKVAALKESISSTEFWDNLVVRQVNGHGFELAYGHNRLQALLELGIKTIDVPVRELDDATMLRMMAHENRAEWGAAAAIEQETIRAVVAAYAAGIITLSQPDKKARDDRVRNAPTFTAGSSAGSAEHPYTAETLQEFLGFKGESGLHKIKDTLNALALIELGVVRKEDVGDLTVYKMKLVHQVAKDYEHEPAVQKKVARGVAKKLRDGDITGFDQERATRAKLEAARIAHAHNVKSKSEMKRARQGKTAVHTQDDEAAKLTTDLGKLLQYSQVLKRVGALARFAADCSPTARRKLLTALTKLRDQLDTMITRFERSGK